MNGSRVPGYINVAIFPLLASPGWLVRIPNQTARGSLRREGGTLQGVSHLGDRRLVVEGHHVEIMATPHLALGVLFK